MGKNDIAVKQWLSDKERFADLFNGIIFGGRKVIRASELELISGESDILLKDKKGREKILKRYRDIVMRWKQEVEFMILASENQDKIHYAMPVRNMVYDGLSYTEQIEQIWKEHKERRDKIKGSAFLSHFEKSDAIFPVITLVFYYGDKPWDASLDIHGMFPAELMEIYHDTIEKYVPNYRINLVDISKIENPERFGTDLQVVFGMLKYKNEKEKLVNYIYTNKNYFENVPLETYQAVQVFLNLDKKFKDILPDTQEREEINMCKALDDWFEEGVEQGIVQGEERISRLAIRLMAENRYKDLEKALNDKEYRARMFRELMV